MENLNGVKIEQEEEMATLSWGSYSKRVNIKGKSNDPIVSSVEEELAARDEERRLDSAVREVSEGTLDEKTL
jgi:hypothetical protein